jgi:predicted short-subunit dehydrogenase-like oxidoreductase (DUF2520 family)
MITGIGDCMKIAVIGVGRVGRPLSEAIGIQGHTVVTYDRSAIVSRQFTDLSGVDLAFLALPDRILSKTARNISAMPSHGLVHCSGQTRNTELGLRASMFHPMMSFTGNDTAEIFRGCPIGITSDDSVVVDILKRLAEEIGGHPFVFDESRKETYHVAGMFASVFPLIMLFQSLELLEKAGISKQDASKIVVPIFRRATDHILSEDQSGVITGPVPREDIATIEAHLEQLSENETSQEIYRAMTRLSLQYCSLDERAQKTIEEAIS